jgi:hypothetical protein
VPKPRRPNSNAKKTKREREEQELKPIPWWYLGQRDPVARFTGWLVIFTACLVMVGVLQWITTQGQTQDQESLTVAQLQANLRRENPVFHPKKRDGSYIINAGDQIIGWDVNPRWTNIGAVDADSVVTSWKIKIVPMPSTPPTKQVIRNECPDVRDPSNTITATVPPGGGIVQVAQFLSVEDAQRAISGKQLVLLAGYIDYSDQLPKAKTRRHDWCLLLVPIDLAANQFTFFLIQDDII